MGLSTASPKASVLVLDWTLLLYGTDDGSDPYQAISSNIKQDQYNRTMNAKAIADTRGTLLEYLNQLFAPVSGVVGSVRGAIHTPVFRRVPSQSI
jgi:hypothetical protein